MLEFSIIIPVYNAEKTLERCLKSINEQTFSDYEVILIDDGSSDSSLSICEKFENRDSRYHVIHQSNSGPSVARNAGLDVAKGEWVCFVDSDDTVEGDYLQTIFSATQESKVDVVFMGYYKLYENGEKVSFIPNDTYESKTQTLIYLSERDMFGYTWIKCFRREIIKKCRFDSSLNLFEDEVFTCQVLPRCGSVGVVQKPIYNYYTGNGNTLVGRTHDDYCLKCDKVYKAWNEMLSIESIRQSFMNKKANSFVSCCYYYAFERNVDIKKFFGYMRETTFFQEHTDVSVWDELVINGNYKKLYFAKKRYQAKVYISAWIRKKGRKI